MNTNISYHLDEHGWSTCWIFANDKLLEIPITHIFPENPIEVCLNALMGIMKGEPERKFIWYGEPGGEQITIKEAPGQKHLVSFRVEGFADEHGEEITDLETTIEFEIKKKQLILMFYYEFKKIAELMKDKDYEEHRKQEFPFEKFRSFESVVIDYLGLK